MFDAHTYRKLLNNLNVATTLKLNGSKRNVYYYSFTKQLSQPLNKQPKCVTAEEALQTLKSGRNI